ncbi:MAG: apolipoprotein N-acyltransferase [Alphaproteobacteria bacterium]|nr:apolipoprotein N-acyltransferase [Alphaproteobacteria bacterium]
MKVYVNYQDKRWKKYKIDFEKIANAAVSKAYKNAEVSITLVDDKEIKNINKKYRKINKPTNVLSFELGDDVLLGDIFISLDTVKAEAKKEGLSIEEHTAHMVVHGVLHLQGYDHVKDSDAVQMESKETAILKKLGYKNPYSSETNICMDESCCPGSKTINVFKKFFNSVFGRTLLFLVFGAVSALGFAPFNMWWFTVIGIGGAYLLSLSCLPGRGWFRKFFIAFPFGFAYAIAMFWWVLNSIYVVPELAEQFAVWTVPAVIGIGLVGGIIFTIPFLAISSVRANPACRPFLFASVWTVVLWLREWLFTGFPWNPVANISLNNIYLANTMSLFGALGLTFIIIGLIAGFCEIIKDKRSGDNWFTLFVFILLGALGIVYSVKNIERLDSDKNTSTPLVRIIQPAQSAVQKATHSREMALQKAQENIENLVNLASAEGDYDLIVFPETSYPFVIVKNDTLPLAKRLNKPVIIGANYFNSGKMYNSMIIANENGDIDKVYSKSHLVPFGEYRPFGDIIPTPGQLTPGDGPEIISMDIKGFEFSFAPAICYEIIFSDSLLPTGKNPDAIVNITNDNWFGDTPGTYQHLDMVRRYAIESGLPIIRANYSGISAFVLPTGQIVAEQPVGQAGNLDSFVHGAHKTAYRELGRDNWMIIILIISCLCTIWLSGVSRNRK